MKTCTTCQQLKPLTKYSRDWGKGYRDECKACIEIKAVELRKRKRPRPKSADKLFEHLDVRPEEY